MTPRVVLPASSASFSLPYRRPWRVTGLVGLRPRQLDSTSAAALDQLGLFTESFLKFGHQTGGFGKIVALAAVFKGDLHELFLFVDSKVSKRRCGRGSDVPRSTGFLSARTSNAMSSVRVNMRHKARLGGQQIVMADGHLGIRRDHPTEDASEQRPVLWGLATMADSASLSLFCPFLGIPIGQRRVEVWERVNSDPNQLRASLGRWTTQWSCPGLSA